MQYQLPASHDVQHLRSKLLPLQGVVVANNTPGSAHATDMAGHHSHMMWQQAAYDPCLHEVYAGTATGL